MNLKLGRALNPAINARDTLEIVSSRARQRTGPVIAGPVARGGSGSGRWLEGGFLAGEPLGLADEVALAALGADA